MLSNSRDAITTFSYQSPLPTFLQLLLRPLLQFRLPIYHPLNVEPHTREPLPPPPRLLLLVLFPLDPLPLLLFLTLRGFPCSLRISFPLQTLEVRETAGEVEADEGEEDDPEAVEGDGAPGSDGRASVKEEEGNDDKVLQNKENERVWYAEGVGEEGVRERPASRAFRGSRRTS
jgi:hypothetical protein